MALSKNEKEQLLIFIKSHYVDHHDVRLLIARDLEEDMTKLMEEDENLSFSDALDQAYKKYGVIGFSDVSEKYMKKINSYFYKHVIKKAVKEEANTFGFWLIVTFSFISIFAIISPLSNLLIIEIGFLVLFILMVLFYFRKLHIEFKKMRKKEDFTYFEELLVSNNSLLLPSTYLPLLIAPNIVRLIDSDVWSMVVMASFFTISVVAMYLIYFNLYKNKSQFLQDYQDNYLSEKINFKLNLI